jgi:glycerophosphoryl diester phosphodiesterase
MIIISHRGFWRDPAEKNSVDAFRRSFEKGLGVETDVRDLDSNLVISHDPPKTGALTFRDFLKLHGKYSGSRPLPLALNIKADGLQAEIKKLLEQYSVKNFFVFDMSVPDLIAYRDAMIPFFTRLSEYEREPVLLDDAHGVWLDGFHTDWFSTGEVTSHLSRGKRVCVVSPELHGRAHQTLWKRLKEVDTGSEGRLMLCTDLVDEASAFFGKKTGEVLVL